MVEVTAGMRIGRWMIVSLAPARNRNRQYNCHCDCGTVRAISHYNLASGRTKSCGCARRRPPRIGRLVCAAERRNPSEYRAWTRAKTRCYNSNVADFPNYGARGIRVCDRWLNSFENFLADMGPKPTPKHTLDRIDVDGDYEPDNCRWATQKEQQNNRTNNHLLTRSGRTMTLSQWSQETGLSYGLISNRLRRGWSVERALGTPLK